jgi:hypothetical protein
VCVVVCCVVLVGFRLCGGGRSGGVGGVGAWAGALLVEL